MFDKEFLTKRLWPKLFFVLFLGVHADSQTTSSILLNQQRFSKSYVCYRTDSPILIDGKIEEGAWQKVEWTDDFVDIEGSIRPSPRFRTRAKMLWDAKYFYIAAELEEPEIWATLLERDTVIYHNNDFEIFIDPDGDTHQYYELELNALNTVWDLLLIKPYRDGGPAVIEWDIKGLRTGVSVEGTLNRPGDKDRCWTVEVALPWDALRECAHRAAPPRSGEQWRVNFSRVEWQVEIRNGKYQKIVNPNTGKPYPEDNWIWSPHGLINMHYPEMWGFIQFSERISGKGEDAFLFDLDEYAKWVLRQVYYREKEYFEKHTRYSTDINELGLSEMKTEEYSLPPVIQQTDDLFEATIMSLDGKKKWHISQDGRVWEQNIQKF
jgi:hypothetical protein